MAALGRNLTAPLGAEGDVDVSLDAADCQFESHKRRLRQKAESASDGAATFNALGAESEQDVTGRHVGAKTNRQGQRSNDLGDGLNQDHSGHEGAGGTDGHQVSQHILGGIGPSVNELGRPDADRQTWENGQD